MNLHWWFSFTFKYVEKAFKSQWCSTHLLYGCMRLLLCISNCLFHSCWSACYLKTQLCANESCTNVMTRRTFSAVFFIPWKSSRALLLAFIPISTGTSRLKWWLVIEVASRNGPLLTHGLSPSASSLRLITILLFPRSSLTIALKYSGNRFVGA